MREQEAAWLVALILLAITAIALFGGFHFNGRGWAPNRHCQLVLPGGFVCAPTPPSALTRLLQRDR